MNTLARNGGRTSVARVLSGRSNLVLGVFDQGVSSVTNLGLNIAVASTASSETFGALGVAITLYLLEFGIVYGAIVEPYSVDQSARGETTSQAVAASVAVGLVLTAVHLGLAALASGTLATFLLVYALATPGLVVQMSSRGLLIAHRLSRTALESNVIWAAALVIGGAVALAVDSTVGVFVAWAAGGWASAAYCLWHLGTGPRIAAWRTWFQGRMRIAGSWAGEYVAQQGMAQIAVFTLGAVAGLAAVGSYRGAIQLTGPATVVVGGLRQVLLPGAARRARARDGSLRRGVDAAAVAFPAVSFVLVAPFLLLPGDMGIRLLGETWDGARAVLPWILVMRMANTATAAFALGLRATHEYRATFSLRVLGGAATLIAATAAGARWGATGAAAAMATVAIIQSPFWRAAFIRQPRHRVLSPR